MDHRKVDLSQSLDNSDLDALQAEFKKAGWDVGTAEILAVARDISPSNHWKDIIQGHLKAKEEAQEKEGSDTPPKSDSAAPKEKGSTSGKRRPRKSADK